ncbi:MAG: hypothetical protein KatS3mg109_0684 [Pirellulaceae bacterium]|nr:MAG: hypothetical protein KatS3mg109_0684 [Pirellulaceae bacterium]
MSGQTPASPPVPLASAGSGWNAFWFRPAPTTLAAQLRCLAALAGLYFFVAWSEDLWDWFGPSGLWPRSLAAAVASDFGAETSYRFSVLQLSSSPAALLAIHLLLIANSVWLAWGGPAARYSALLHLVGLLSYMHRATLLTGPFEAVLAFLALYVVIEPAGSVRLTHCLRMTQPTDRRVSANVVRRCVQLHLTAVYLCGGLTMLAGEVWWNGTASWWLLAAPESRQLDLARLVTFPKGIYLLNLITHTLLAFHLAFPILVWSQRSRNSLRRLAWGAWLLVALVSGLWSYAALMAGASWIAWQKLPDAD